MEDGSEDSEDYDEEDKEEDEDYDIDSAPQEEVEKPEEKVSLIINNVCSNWVKLFQLAARWTQSTIVKINWRINRFSRQFMIMYVIDPNFPHYEIYSRVGSWANWKQLLKLGWNHRYNILKDMSEYLHFLI